MINTALRIIITSMHMKNEKRYFTSGQQASIVEFKGVKLALAICEDVWFDRTIDHMKQLGAELVLTLNASP